MTLEELTFGPLKIVPLDAAKVLGYGQPGRLFPYNNLPTVKELERRGIFDSDKCDDKFRAEVVWMNGRTAEIVSYDEPDGQLALRECHARILRNCGASTGDLVMFYLGSKNGKRVTYTEKICNMSLIRTMGIHV